MPSVVEAEEEELREVEVGEQADQSVWDEQEDAQENEQ